MRYEKSIDIDAPAATVWAVLTDVERWPEWTASMTSVQRLDDGPLAAGSRARIKQPRLRATTMEVDDVEPGRSFRWTGRSGGVTAVGGHRIDERPGGVTATLTIELSGPLAPVAALVGGRLTRRYVDMEAAGLKARSESSTA